MSFKSKEDAVHFAEKQGACFTLFCGDYCGADCCNVVFVGDLGWDYYVYVYS